MTSGRKHSSSAPSAVYMIGLPDRTGTLASVATSFATCLSAKTSMVEARGPSHARPAPSTAFTKSTFSDRKPYPGWMAVAPVSAAACRSGARGQQLAERRDRTVTVVGWELKPTPVHLSELFGCQHAADERTQAGACSTLSPYQW